MLTACSVENFIAKDMDKYGMAALFLGELCQLYGIPASQTRLSQALRGTKPFSNEVGLRVRALVREIAEYCDSKATPVALTSAAEMKVILDQRRAAKKIFEEVAIEMAEVADASTETISTTT